MENKRVILAVALCAVVLFGWSYLFPPAPQPQAPTQAPAAAPAPAASAPAPAALPAQAVEASPARDVVVETPLYTAVLSTQGGIMKRFVLKKYRQSIDAGSANVDLVGESAESKAPLGLIVSGVPTWSRGKWSGEGGDVTLEAGQTRTLTLVGEAEGFRIERRLTFSGDTYLVTEEAVVANAGRSSGEVRTAFTAATRSLSAEDDSYNPTRVSYYAKGSLHEDSDRKDLREKGVTFTGQASWGAIQSNYFIVAVLPKAEDVTVKGGYQDDIFRVAVEEAAAIEQGGQKTFACAYFFGPAERAVLAKAPGHLSGAVDFGWFSFVAEPLLWMLEFLHSYVGNYGWAIILLTVLIKILFWPLSQKSYKSMEQMRKLQPMMAKLREKYGDDRQKLNEEMMQLYKTYKVNPAGGCVPMILQIPVFFGLYKALLGAIELRHASFITHVPFTDMIWLADLSAKDPYYVTPLIMGATMFLQQKMTPPAGDPMQAKVMLLMPVVFTFMFLNFPSGLVVYWLVNNVLSIAQQWLMMQRSKPAGNAALK